MASYRAVSFSVAQSNSTVDGVAETENLGESENTYILRPIFQQRFRPSVVKDCIHAVLKEELTNVEYSPEEMPQLTKHLSESIKDKLKEMGFDRYKMVVQVVIGEQRGEGVFMAARCFWDADTDNYMHDVFMNNLSNPCGSDDFTVPFHITEADTSCAIYRTVYSVLQQHSDVSTIESLNSWEKK